MPDAGVVAAAAAAPESCLDVCESLLEVWRTHNRSFMAVGNIRQGVYICRDRDI
jgi:hypothetical protein